MKEERVFGPPVWVDCIIKLVHSILRETSDDSARAGIFSFTPFMVLAKSFVVLVKAL